MSGSIRELKDNAVDQLVSINNGGIFEQKETLQLEINNSQNKPRLQHTVSHFRSECSQMVLCTEWRSRFAIANESPGSAGGQLSLYKV